MDLSQEQSQTVDTFVEITNWSGSRDEAVALLQSSSWNVETAVMLHFDGSAAPAPAAPISTGTSAASTHRVASSLLEDMENEALTADLDQEVAPRINPNPPVYTPARGGLTIIQTVLLAPLHIGYKMFNTILYFLSWLFPFLPRLTGYYPANRNATRARSDTADPQTIASRYIQSFEEKYGESELPFFRGGYTNALELAKKELRYLVVVLQSDEHDLTAQFNKKVLLDPKVVELLSRPDVVFWAGNVAESEAYLVASGLEVTKFPFVSLIAPSPKSPTSAVLVMTVLAKLKGKITADSFVSSVEESMESHQPKLLALVLDKQERDLNRQLREEQDSAYERSLAADREREARARDEREQEQRRREEALALEEQKRVHQEKVDQWRKWRVGELHKLITAVDSADKSARVSIRLQTGQRIVQKFGADATVDDLYAFVDCYDLLKGYNAEENDDREPPADYKHRYLFELISPMPRKALKPDPELKVRDEPAVWPNGSLVVEDDGPE